MHGNNMRTDLGGRDARIVESDHVLSGDACCRQCLEQQVCTEVLGSTHQQTRSLHRAVHLNDKKSLCFSAVIRGAS